MKYAWACVVLSLSLLMLLSGIAYRLAPSYTRTTSASVGRKLGNTTCFSSTAGRTATMKYRAPIVIPAKEKHTATFFLLHGLGDQGDGWSEMAGQFQAALKHVKFVFPHAAVQPVSLNGGMPMPSWFDIASLSSIDLKADKEGILESRRYVEELIAAEVKAGVPTDRIVVAGFSQGGAIALNMLASDTKLAGVVGLSTWLAVRDAPAHVSPANKETPILMCHGDQDQVVQYQYGKLSSEKLLAEGAKVQFKTYRGMGHSSAPAELLDVAAFVQSCLPPV